MISPGVKQKNDRFVIQMEIMDREAGNALDKGKE